MKILAIEPHDHWHWEFDAFFIRCLQRMGTVTFIAPEGYLESCSVDYRHDIPTNLLKARSKVGARVSAFRILLYILRKVRLDDYDVIVFLSYETISFSLIWPKNRKVFLFEHNNITNALGNWIKTYFYRRIPEKAVAMTLQQHISEYLEISLGRDTLCVPHPYYRSDVDDQGRIREEDKAPRKLMDRDTCVIASLSGSTLEESNEALREMARQSGGKIYVICKGKKEETSEHYEVRPFFDNYKDVMKNCDAMFVGAKFDYRVSGVAYEALSYGKPLILMDCKFSRELRQSYPKLVYVVNDVSEIMYIDLNMDEIKEDRDRFFANHSFDAITSSLSDALASYVKNNRPL